MGTSANPTPDGSGNQPPVGGGQAPNAGDSGGGNLGNPPAGSGSGLEREKLNPLIRGMNEEQLNEVFDTLFTAARNANNSGVPAHARQPETPPAPRALSVDELREKMDPNSDKFDPMSVIEQHIRTNYAPLLGDISRRALSGVEVALRQQFSDFDKYKPDIDLILQGRDPTTISQQDMLAAYYMARGARSVEAERREAAKPPTTQTPSPQAEPKGDPEDQLTDTEMDVAKIMFRDSADPAAAFKAARARAAKGVTKVPGDKK